MLSNGHCTVHNGSQVSPNCAGTQSASFVHDRSYFEAEITQFAAAAPRRLFRVAPSGLPSPFWRAAQKADSPLAPPPPPPFAVPPEDPADPPAPATALHLCASHR